MTAEYDGLRDEGELYGKRLQEAGVPAKVSRYDSMIHDFPDMFEEPGNRAVAEISAVLRAAFSTDAKTGTPTSQPSASTAADAASSAKPAKGSRFLFWRKRSAEPTLAS